MAAENRDGETKNQYVNNKASLYGDSFGSSLREFEIESKNNLNEITKFFSNQTNYDSYKSDGDGEQLAENMLVIENFGSGSQIIFYYRLLDQENRIISIDKSNIFPD